MLSFRIKSKEDYQNHYKRSIQDPSGFWSEIAENYNWSTRWKETMVGSFREGNVKWFTEGKLNITENCLDRHAAVTPGKTAIVWEPNEPTDEYKALTYRELLAHVSALGNVLRSKGVGKGDRVAIYLPMIPELLVAVLACARIGAVHSVVFAGFSARSLADRINDCQCKMVITADGLFRGKQQVSLKTLVDQALAETTSVDSVLVVKRTNETVDMQPGRDFWLAELTAEAPAHCEPEIMDSEDPLFVLYTSGSTGKPKGILHTCGGYMVYAGYSFANVFQADEGDVFWCTADLGWITGHTYLTYGPLLMGITTVMFEGVPTYPTPARFWEVCDKHAVNQFYTAPTAIRALMLHGESYPNSASLSTLKTIGTVGEPINKEAWDWYFEHVGRRLCALVDTWWQTETGGIMISGIGSYSAMKATYAGLPLPGVKPVLLDQSGLEINEPNTEGLLAIKHPWPSMLRTIFGDHERCMNTYFTMFPGYYFTGDGAWRDPDGMFRIIGRVDDVINVSGHRFGTAEIENAINAHHTVVESAVVGYPHDVKGQGILAFVIMSDEGLDEVEMREAVCESVVHHIGKIARPDRIVRVLALPKTRSGKIMRRILRKIAEGDTSNLGDTSTLLDPSVVEQIIVAFKVQV